MVDCYWNDCTPAPAHRSEHHQGNEQLRGKLFCLGYALDFRFGPKADSQRLGYRAKIRPAMAAKNAARLTVSKANSVRRNLNPDKAHTSSVALTERRNAPPVYAATPCRTLTCKGALRDPPSASSPVCKAMTPALPDIAASIRRIAFPPIRSNADDGLSGCDSPSVPWLMSFPLPRSMAASGR